MSQQGPLQRCNQCGANLGAFDLRGTNCRYCGTALPHHARAAEHAALVNQVLNQQFQARGLAPPQSPVVPYQYGAQPNMPYPPGSAPNMHMIGASVDQAAKRGIAAAIIISVVVALVLMMAVGGVIAWTLVR